MAHAYGYGPLGLVQRFTPGGSAFYNIYMFDPHGNVAQRIQSSNLQTVVVDTAVYDSFGMLHVDKSAQSAGGYPVSDAISGLAQFGSYTDEELRTARTRGRCCTVAPHHSRDVGLLPPIGMVCYHC